MSRVGFLRVFSMLAGMGVCFLPYRYIYSVDGWMDANTDSDV